MAERKAPQLEPVLDSKSDADYLPKDHSLPKQSYLNVLRMIHNGSKEQVLAIRAATHQNLKRLAVRRNLDKAVKHCPKGSDQVDIQSVVKWAASVRSGDRKSIRQLVAIDATSVDRST